MKIYLIEKGYCRQHGEIVAAFTKLHECIDEFDRLQDVEERKAYTSVTTGINEFDKTPGVIFGFWSGPESGNTHANGWRVREIEAK